MDEKRAAFFNVGDLVTYGKYQNKKGKIVRFGDDGKGNPTVEIEPVPKGRKQNKTLALFKIRRFKEKTAMDLSVDRVASRYRVATRRLQAKVMQVGETLEDEKTLVRLHMYSGSLHVTDLTFAGKRGKKVDSFNFDFFYKRDDSEALTAAFRIVDAALKKGYKEALKVAQQQSENLEAVKVFTKQEMGVRVTPAGFKALNVDGEHVYVSVDYKGFSVKDKDDLHNEPTCISRGRQKDVRAFYRWVKDNEAALKRMKFHDVTKMMSAEGIDFHQYCAID